MDAGEHVLHLGCGTGYYNAILAELFGPQGSVSALEIDERLADRAQRSLEPWTQARVVNAEGASHASGSGMTAAQARLGLAQRPR